MDFDSAVNAFAALAHQTRLRAFKMLVVAGPAGLAAGRISAGLQLPHNTLSFHLAYLCDAGLIQSRKQGRSVIYSANYQMTCNLIYYMVENCCASDSAWKNEEKSSIYNTMELFSSCCSSQKLQ